jgi:hypothetical protein
MGLHEITKLHKTKKIVTRLKRQSTEWEIIFASCTSDKELITRNIQGTQTTKLFPKKSMIQ